MKISQAINKQVRFLAKCSSIKCILLVDKLNMLVIIKLDSYYYCSTVYVYGDSTTKPKTLVSIIWSCLCVNLYNCCVCVCLCVNKLDCMSVCWLFVCMSLRMCFSLCVWVCLWLFFDQYIFILNDDDIVFPNE